MSTVSYTTFDDAIYLLLKLGQGTLFSKTDIADAYRMIPVQPDNYSLLRFGYWLYYDTCLPMGGAPSSCAIFDILSSGLEWRAKDSYTPPHFEYCR